MKIDSNNNTNCINKKQVLIICNALRSLGLKTSHTGTRLLIKSVQILSVKDLEIVIIEDIFKEISTYFPNIKQNQIRNHIAYALDNRDKKKSKDNFENFFGFEYDTSYFTPKIFLEEFSNIIRLESI